MKYAIPLVLVASLVGCGGGDSTASETLSGTVIDGTIAGATVCLDINSDLKCNGDEPTTTSDTGGRFSLDIPPGALDAANVTLIAEVAETARDSDDGGATLAEVGRKPFVLLAPAMNGVAITAASTAFVADVRLGFSPVEATARLKSLTGHNAALFESSWTSDSVGATQLLAISRRGSAVLADIEFAPGGKGLTNDGLARFVSMANGIGKAGNSPDGHDKIRGLNNAQVATHATSAAGLANTPEHSPPSGGLERASAAPVTSPCFSSTYFHLPLSIVTPVPAVLAVGSTMTISVSGGTFRAGDPVQIKATSSNPQALSIAKVGAATFALTARQPTTQVDISVVDARCPLSALAKSRVKIAVPPVISSFSGGGHDWLGQPARAPLAVRNSDQYNHTGRPGSNFVAIDYYADVSPLLTLRGSGFGTISGASSNSIRFSDPKIIVSAIVKWTNTEIVVRAVTNTPAFTFNDSVTASLTTPDGLRTESKPLPVAGTIRTRPVGQCTWEVAKQRLLSGGGRLEPRASAYTTNTAINFRYVPAQWDAIVFGADKHVGIISSPVSVQTARDKASGKTRATYSFKISDRNSQWHEDYAETQATFVVEFDARSLPTRIVSGFARAGSAATGAYR